MKETPEQIISKCVNNIVREIASWKYIQKYGCNDPFWPDGCNMNITRNLELIWERTETKKMTIEEMRQKLEELTGEEIEVTA